MSKNNSPSSQMFNNNSFKKSHDPERNVVNRIIFTTFIYGIFALILTHSISFAIEYFYQQYCYPISAIGFFTSVLTTNSNTCISIKNVINNLNGLISNYILQSTGMVIVIMKKLLAI